MKTLQKLSCVILALAILFLANEKNQALSVCCANRITSRGCCSQGDCNKFCCNCDTSSSSAIKSHVCDSSCNSDIIGFDGGKNAQTATADAKKTFDVVDANGNGVVTFEEAAQYLVVYGGYDAYQIRVDPSWWEDMDKNGNWVVEPREFDDSLVQ
jgi:hypothetical protein